MPRAASTSTMTGTCGSSAGRRLLDAALSASASRCALYEGSAATRNAGRQSSSQHATSRVGRPPRRRAWRSCRGSPRTALTGVPSGAFTDSGTPKNARKYSDAESSSSRRSGTGEILPAERGPR